MQPFLKKLATYIHTHYAQNLSEVCVVLPSRRAKVFLKEHLSNVFDKPVWAPQLYSIEDFISELADAESLDSLSTLFEFYTVYVEIEKTEAQSLDDFLQWAPTLLQDFNELDQYLVNAKELFDYLSDEKAITLWNIDGSALSDFQKKYLKFWKSLSEYYPKFIAHLNSKNLVYPGLAYRKVAETSVELAQRKNWHKIIFAGFNALNTAERKILKSLAEAEMADIVWDADDYYLNDTNQEAGKFMREFKETLGKYNKEKKFLWNSNSLSESPKKIVIAGVAQQVSQAKVAGDILAKMNTDGNYKRHALVLADENLLMPVLHAIPESVAKYNVTMGYPLSNLSLQGLLEAIFQLHENALAYAKEDEGMDARYYYRDLKKIFLHPSLSAIFKTEQGHFVGQDFIHFLETQNWFFVSYSQIETYFASFQFADHSALKVLLSPWNNKVSNCLDALLLLLTLLKEQITQGSDPLDSEVLFHYTKTIKRIQSLTETASIDGLRQIKTVQTIFNQLIKAQQIAFVGEPLDGLQIMGMLETRTLDFDTVILLSANEGVLPVGKKENSFIPLELKSKFGLPTYAEKDAIFGYHFYRLLQCAQSIYLVYNTETDELGNGERSRYIKQLQQELQKVNSQVQISELLYTIPLLASTGTENIVVEKNEFVMERLGNLISSGLSPSLLNTYRNCSLQFYFRYIARLKEKEEPEESLDSAAFGTVIHSVLEQNYIPLIGKNLSQESVLKAFQDSAQKIESAFRTEFKLGDLKSGKNLLNLKVAEKYVATFLAEELKFIEWLDTQNQQLKILSLESEYTHNLDIGEHSVLLKGKIDRIDSIDNLIRIIDYKTGAVNESSDLKLKAWDELQEVKKNKSFQLFMYAYLFHKGDLHKDKRIVSGIISLRKLSAGLMPASLNQKEELDAQLLLEFEQELKTLIASILSPETSFNQTVDLKVCDNCAYSQICNR
ncbi:MAG: PD-(D/E)XK nuclease family protein [Bacteroidetes bacterium]|nr:PD-(D/E)XK nuclease family protein [Bacteroidota bacterium]